jgi:hypothetical protein
MGNHDLIPVKGKRFVSSPKHPDWGLGSTQTPIEWVLGAKWSGYVADQPPPSITKVKNNGGYMSAPCICLHGIYNDKFMVTYCCPWYQMGHFVMR